MCHGGPQVSLNIRLGESNIRSFYLRNSRNDPCPCQTVAPPTWALVSCKKYQKNDIYSGLGEENDSVESKDASGKGREDKVDQTSQEINVEGSEDVEKTLKEHQVQESGDDSRSSVSCDATHPKGPPQNEVEDLVHPEDRYEMPRCIAYSPRCVACAVWSSDIVPTVRRSPRVKEFRKL